MDHLLPLRWPDYGQLGPSGPSGLQLCAAQGWTVVGLSPGCHNAPTITPRTGSSLSTPGWTRLGCAPQGGGPWCPAHAEVPQAVISLGLEQGPTKCRGGPNVQKPMISREVEPGSNQIAQTLLLLPLGTGVGLSLWGPVAYIRWPALCGLLWVIFELLIGTDLDQVVSLPRCGDGAGRGHYLLVAPLEWTQPGGVAVPSLYSRWDPPVSTKSKLDNKLLYLHLQWPLRGGTMIQQASGPLPGILWCMNQWGASSFIL